MPIYEYVCPSCQLKFELLRPFRQAGEAAPCPRCQQSAERILSTFACLSRDDSGFTAPVGGNSCAGCSTSNCSTCGV